MLLTISCSMNQEILHWVEILGSGSDRRVLHEINPNCSKKFNSEWSFLFTSLNLQRMRGHFPTAPSCIAQCRWSLKHRLFCIISDTKLSLYLMYESLKGKKYTIIFPFRNRSNCHSTFENSASSPQSHWCHITTIGLKQTTQTHTHLWQIDYMPPPSTHIHTHLNL